MSVERRKSNQLQGEFYIRYINAYVKVITSGNELEIPSKKYHGFLTGDLVSFEVRFTYRDYFITKIEKIELQKRSSIVST